MDIDSLMEWLEVSKKINKQTQNDFYKIGDKEMSMMQIGKYNAYDDVLRYIEVMRKVS